MIPQTPYKDRNKDIVGIYWHWAENILKKEPFEIFNRKTQSSEENQNLVVNVRQGLDNYGWIAMYNNMAKMLTKKKLYGR
jgi:hypothetical protein